MIVGLDRFRDFLRDYHEQFCLIGGVAAMEWLGDAGLNPRATKDLDIVLIVESLDDRFLDRLWEFIKAGRYDNLQKSTGQRIYYRFNSPQEPDYWRVRYWKLTLGRENGSQKINKFSTLH